MAGRIITLLISLLLWGFFSGRTSPLILPSPGEVGRVFTREIFSQEGMLQTFETLYRFLTAYFLSVASGAAAGIGVFRYKWARDILWPIITALQATPVISWILLALIWFSSGMIPYFILWIFILPIITINTYEGLRGTDPKLIQMAQVYRASSRDIYRKIYLPSALPYLRAGMKISINSALKVLVTAEIIGRLPHGIGSSMNNAWINIETASLMGWTIYLILLTCLLEQGVGLAMERVFRRYL